MTVLSEYKDINIQVIAHLGESYRRITSDGITYWECIVTQNAIQLDVRRCKPEIIRELEQIYKLFYNSNKIN